MRSLVAICTLLVAIHGGAATQEHSFGRFVGEPIRVELLRGSPSERRLKLLTDVRYIDPAGKSWTAEAGFVTDGASIPRPFWSVVGGPLDGPYREAAIVHDKYCVVRSEPYRAVHRMFYYATVAAGVPQQKALVLYGGVVVGGPRWPEPGHGRSGRTSPSDTPTQPPPPKAVTDADVEAISKWVEQQRTLPTPSQLEVFAESRR
jgi:hypothetical protein